ncbi:MAG: FIST N-terminal domain-containing protein [Anaerolineae bacterium]
MKDEARREQIAFASAMTTEADIERATHSLAAQIDEQLAGRSLDLALVFLSPPFGPVAGFVSENLRAALKPGLLIGCTGEGVIGREREVEQGPAIALVGAHLPQVTLRPFAFPARAWADALAGTGAFRQAVGAPVEARLFVLLADPFSTPMDRLLDAFNTAYAQVPVIGGLASGASRPAGNALLFEDRVFSGGAVGVALSGPFDVDVVVSQGCRPIGRPLKITSAQENFILSLEGQPPLVYLQELVNQLSETDRRLLQNGLFIGRAIDPDRDQAALGRGDFLIRGVVGIDQESGVIAIGDYVHQGETVQFHLRDATTATEDLEMMLAPQMFFESPSGAFLFSCNGRGTRLYDHPNGDISTIQKVLGGVNLAGFFCAGEIGPIGGKNFLHGHTASMVLFRPPAGEN